MKLIFIQRLGEIEVGFLIFNNLVTESSILHLFTNENICHIFEAFHVF